MDREAAASNRPGKLGAEATRKEGRVRQRPGGGDCEAAGGAGAEPPDTGGARQGSAQRWRGAAPSAARHPPMHDPRPEARPAQPSPRRYPRRVRWPRTRTEMREAGRASRGDRRAATSLRRTTNEADSARYLRACGVPTDGERRRPPSPRRYPAARAAVGCCSLRGLLFVTREHADHWARQVLRVRGWWRGGWTSAITSSRESKDSYSSAAGCGCGCIAWLGLKFFSIECHWPPG